MRTQRSSINGDQDKEGMGPRLTGSLLCFYSFEDSCIRNKAEDGSGERWMKERYGGGEENQNVIYETRKSLKRKGIKAEFNLFLEQSVPSIYCSRPNRFIGHNLPQEASVKPQGEVWCL